MAIKPAINPNVGVAERPATLAGATNFISGGSTLGSSIVSSAANKIVGFQRGAAAVAAKPPDLGSIIKTLSTSILNNVESKVQSINQNVQQFITNRFQDQQEEYKNKLQGIDSRMPNKILENFLKLYNQAIGYIQFLGDRRNVRQLGDNLKALQEVFTETFQVARTIRQTIVRIVEQLSNLPKAAPGGSGIDVDVNVPGGPLRRALPSKKNLMKMALGGAAVAGAGALGSKVVSGMLDVGGGEVSGVQMGTGDGLSGPLLDRFNSILDRFDEAIKTLASRSGTTSTKKTGTSGVTQPEPEAATPSPGSPGGVTPTGPVGPSKDLVSGAQGFMDLGFTKQGAAYLSGNVQQESGWKGQRDPWVLNDGAGTNKGLMSWNRSRIVAAEKFLGKPLNQATNEEQMKFVKHELETVPQYEEANRIFKDPNATPAQLERASKIYLGYGDVGKRYQYAQTALKGLGGYTAGSRGVQGVQGTPGTPGKPGQPQSVVGVSSPAPTVVAATTQATTQQAVAQKVSQPPPSQSGTKVNVVPLNMDTSKPAATGIQTPPPPALSKGGASVPFLTSTNHDNFLTLYSKMVYNLVD